MKIKKVYWAGGLFDFKELHGNRVLAEAFNRKCENRWRAVLPQESKSNSMRDRNIRDSDLEQLFSADALVANFDGCDLDSGTVVEFCFAKFLDLPTVLLRTDFRNNNDVLTCPNPWNLMCSGYPRTEVVLYNAIINYASTDMFSMAQTIAEKVAIALDRCDAMPRVYPDRKTMFSNFKNVVLAAGGDMRRLFPDERIHDIIADR